MYSTVSCRRIHFSHCGGRKGPCRLHRQILAGARRTYYDILNVPSTASIKEIKNAYRKAALKLHPDVNPAPDAKERFIEAKEAFETLSDESRKASYDRAVRMGGNSSNSNSMDDWARDFTASYQRGSQGTSKQSEEDSYGFEDFFKDLDKEIVSWAKERGGKGGSKASRSLWEELEAIGEELVEFIEETIVGTEDSKSEESDRGLGWTEGPSSPPPPPPPPTRPQSTNKSASPPSTTIDDELAALKKKMGKL